MVSAKCISNAIKAFAVRQNYGIEQQPTASIWRWEVQDLSLIPEEVVESITERRSRRAIAQLQLKDIYDAMTPQQQEAIFSAKKRKNETSFTVRFLDHERISQYVLYSLHQPQRQPK
jgi:hypothetical protein